MEVIRITNEEPFAATKIDWWPPWWAVLPHYLSNLFISLWNNFCAGKICPSWRQQKKNSRNISGGHQQLWNCARQLHYNRNISSKFWGIFVSKSVQAGFAAGFVSSPSHGEKIFVVRKVLLWKSRKLSMSPFRKTASYATPFQLDHFKAPFFTRWCQSFMNVYRRPKVPKLFQKVEIVSTFVLGA